MNLYNTIKSNLKEAEEQKESKSGMTLYDYIKNVCDGEIDMDVCDNDIDMMVAFCHNINEHSSEYPQMERFLNLLAKRTKIIKQTNGAYSPILICDFSSALKPYNEEWKKFFDMDYSEFDEDEAYYEAVVNLEPLISGNAGENTYKEFCDIMEGKKSKDITESDNKSGKKRAYKLNETTNKELSFRKDVFREKVRKALISAGDDDYENMLGWVTRLPEDVVKELEAEEAEINCISMLHSILTYGGSRDVEELVKDRYLNKYIEELGIDKVKELAQQEIDEYNNAEIIPSVYTDTEGVTYNSVKFKDDLKESIDTDKREYWSFRNQILNQLEMYQELLSYDDDDVFGGTEDSYANEVAEQNLFDTIYYHIKDNYMSEDAAMNTASNLTYYLLDAAQNDNISLQNDKVIKEVYDKYIKKEIKESENKSKSLFDEAVDIIDSLGWSCDVNTDDCTIGIENWSPAGEDLYEDLSYGSNDISDEEKIENLKDSMRSLTDSFDIDDHVELYVNLRGQQGVPDSIETLVNDAKDIQGMYNDLYDGFVESISKATSKDLSEADKGSVIKESKNENLLDVNVYAYNKLYYSFSKDEWDEMSEEEKQGIIIDTADQATEEEGHTVETDEVEIIKEAESAKIDPNNLTKEQLWKLRQEIVLGSIFVNDYENSFGLEPIDVCNFFDSFLEEENSDEYGYPLKEERKMSDYDNAEELYRYYSSCEYPFGEIEEIKEAEEKEEEKKPFSSTDFEKNLPYEMRWKEAYFVDDHNTLYWVTQQPFSKEQLNQFAEEFYKTGIPKAAVTVRDFSTYDYETDKKNNVLAYIDADSKTVNSDGYWKEVVAEGWDTELSENNINESASEEAEEEQEEISFDEIEARMANAGDYDDLYAAVDLIADPAIRQGAEDMLYICQKDGDDVETAYSITSTEYVDPYRNEKNIIFKEAEDKEKIEYFNGDTILDDLGSDAEGIAALYEKLGYTDEALWDKVVEDADNGKLYRIEKDDKVCFEVDNDGKKLRYCGRDSANYPIIEEGHK